MSLILDALKKLEQDKVAQLGRQIDLRPAITGHRHPGTPPRWRLPLLIGVALILAVAVAISFDTSLPLRQSPAMTPPAVSQAAPPPQIQTAAPSLPSPPEATRVAISPPLPAVLTTSPTPASQPRSTAAPAPDVPSQRVPPPPTVRLKPSESSAVLLAPADIKVSGIAWQDERSARRAVVNGALVGEGAVVAGYRITEIRPDQVRLSRDSCVFAVPISTSFSGSKP